MLESQARMATCGKSVNVQRRQYSMSDKGLNITILGMIILAVEGLFFQLFVFERVGSLFKGFSYDLIKDYILTSFGGYLLIFGLTFIIVGMIVSRYYERKVDRELDNEINRYIEEIDVDDFKKN